MSARFPTNPYVLGGGDLEHERLARQSILLAPSTERVLREAGIVPGQRVLDVGSGIGDVALIVARLVGSSGEVVGIERDARSVARANDRMAQAALHNVSFVESDLYTFDSTVLFDAVVGRFILEFLPDPVLALRFLARFVRPDGIFVFHEPAYAPYHLIGQQSPLWVASTSLLREALRRSGANTEIGTNLTQVFYEAGMPAPTMLMEVLLGNNPAVIELLCDLLGRLQPTIETLALPHDAIGHFATLSARLRAEIAASRSPVPFIALLGAWARKPLR